MNERSDGRKKLFGFSAASAAVLGAGIYINANGLWDKWFPANPQNNGPKIVDSPGASLPLASASSDSKATITVGPNPTATVEAIPQFDFPGDTPFVQTRLLSNAWSDIQANFLKKDKVDQNEITTAVKYLILKDASFLETQMQVKGMHVVDASTIVTPQRSYLLTDPNQRFLAALAVQDLLYLYSYAGIINGYDANTNPNSVREQERLAKLGEHVTFVENNVIPAYFNGITQLTPVFELFDTQKVPYPKKWAASAYKAPNDNTYDKNLGIAYTDMYNPFETLADYFKTENRQFYSDFAPSVHKAEALATRDLYPFDDLVNIDPYTPETTDETKFSQTLKYFLTDGQAFRNRIAYAKATGDSTALTILSAKYDAMVKFFGFETMEDGTLRTNQQLKKGDVAAVNDRTGSPKGVGVYVKPEPRADKNPDWPSLFNSRLVRITDNPQIVLYPTNTPEGREYVKVVWVEKNEDGTYKNLDVQGYMPLQYLDPQT